MLCHGHLLRIVATHLGLRPVERRLQVRRLLDEFDTPRMPVVLMGDINEWLVWGRPLRWLTSHFKPAQAPPTFPSRRPVFALDRIWMHPRWRLLRVHAHRSRLARVASDHLPLMARIVGRPLGVKRRPAPGRPRPGKEVTAHGQTGLTEKKARPDRRTEG